MHEHHIPVTRTARYEMLGTPSEQTAEVWFALHGYGQLAADFIAPFGALDDGTRLIVAPEALNRFYLISTRDAPAAERPVGATWMTREDRESDIADYVGYLDRLYAAIFTQLRRERVVVRALGFSQGVATVVRWHALGRAQIDQLIVWGGALPPDVDLRHGAPSLRGVPLRIIVGSRDEFAGGALLDRELARLAEHGVRYEHTVFEGGHALNRAMLRRVASEPVTRLTSHPAAGR